MVAVGQKAVHRISETKATAEKIGREAKLEIHLFSFLFQSVTCQLAYSGAAFWLPQKINSFLCRVVPSFCGLALRDAE